MFVNRLGSIRFNTDFHHISLRQALKTSALSLSKSTISVEVVERQTVTKAKSSIKRPQVQFLRQK